MSVRRLPSPLLVATDRHGSTRPLVDTVRAVLDGGCRWVWFRERDLPPDERWRLAETVLGAVRAAGGRLSVGGDPALALVIGADGVHLGGDADAEAIVAARRTLGEGALIGVSAHALPDAVMAASAGADYVTLSPIFETGSKPGYGPALGVSAVQAASHIGIPVIALGGVAPDAAWACRAAGAAGVAVMGGLMRASDASRETQRYLASLQVAGADAPATACERQTSGTA